MQLLTLLSLVYLGAQLISLALSWPQLHKLLVMKEADEMSLSTWLSWTITQGITTLYSAANHQILWFSMSLMWFLFEVAMVVLILKYSKPKHNAELSPVIER